MNFNKKNFALKLGAFKRHFPKMSINRILGYVFSTKGCVNLIFHILNLNCNLNVICIELVWEF